MRKRGIGVAAGMGLTALVAGTLLAAPAVAAQAEVASPMGLVKYPDEFRTLGECQAVGNDMVRRTWAWFYECKYTVPWALYYEPR
ncbi:hypothetical protein [Amycolatopsis suaedae]|uniref:Secreted protein n=1 Tax=Amycolatopsis suaedae TaxID=2510978 RepID=A0A4Q7IYZ0_9PSEU|nr:hypothetical protein [Amycolatopsis suaedae]RZQ59689.1 hypothetical protein EWH70_33240 [Amycolatopsis suaedae]